MRLSYLILKLVVIKNYNEMIFKQVIIWDQEN